MLSRVCAGCGGAGAAVCETCLAVIDGTRPSRSLPHPVPDGMPPTWSAAPYAGVVRSMIVAWKDADRVEVAPALARLLASTIVAALTDSPVATAAITRGQPVVIVPIPSRARSVRARGRRPLEELVARIVSGVGPVVGVMSVPALQLERAVLDQAGLGQQARAANLRHAMRVEPRQRDALDGAVAILVDDVVTTGSTLSEAARVLAPTSVGPVLAATVAATVRWGSAGANERAAQVPPSGGPG